ncbi:MAG: translocation/assembly module TamB domain-containing protein, partial [Acidobacteriota bacterium]|nr:translocation/assembly module TamB domain-containing protein [Acidobacteriota bacterium]
MSEMHDPPVEALSIKEDVAVRHDMPSPPGTKVRRRRLRWALTVCAVAVAVALVGVVTIDLGPVVRGQAERGLAGFLDRNVSIGRVGVHLLRGQFVVEDLMIGGLRPGDRPFLTAEQITLSTTWSALWHGEFLADAVSMTNWRMLAESFADGTQSFPAFVRQSDEVELEPDAVASPPETDPAVEATRRFVTTLEFLHAADGEFRYEDHGSDYSVIAPNLDFTITNIIDYRGHASFSGGTIQIRDFEPMWADMAADFKLDGALVTVTRMALTTDGAQTELTGSLDLGNFPEMVYDLESDVDFIRMREIFFADDQFVATGEGTFTGRFHKFEGGHDLQGVFTSNEAGINTLRFADVAGDLVWQSDRFAVIDVTMSPYDGQARLDFEMAPLGGEQPGRSVFDVQYEDVELHRLARALGVVGIRPLARATGRNRLEWPIPAFADFTAAGTVELAPADGMRLATSEISPLVEARVVARGDEPADLTTREFAFGGSVSYKADATRLEFAPGYIATPSTHVVFEGRTDWGANTTIPFRVVSTNWQESDRLMAAVMTGVGTPTSAFAVDGYGTLDGAVSGHLGRPRIEATFAGELIRAWNVEWGAGRGEFVVDDAYLNVVGGRFLRDGSELLVDGMFTLGGPRADGGEDMNAVVRMTALPASNIRSAFGLTEGYAIDGPATGEVHLYGAYRRLFGFGQLSLDHPVAYGEPFDSATADLRFEGTGVRLNGLEIRKGDGGATGAAFIKWDSSYSFNLDARNIGVDTLAFLPSLPQSPSGTLEGAASGVGLFDDPRYVVRGTISDLYIGDEEVGHVTGRINVGDGDLRLDLEAASSTIAVSATGRVGLAAPHDTDLSLRVANWSLDPYIRMFVPEWSPFTRAVVSGSLDVFGELNWPRLRAEATIDRVDLGLLDYDVRNNAPIRIVLDRQVVGIDQLRLAGEGTALELSGAVDLARDEVSVGMIGDANLSILQGFLRDLRGAGSAAVEAEITGSVQRPVLTGQASVSDGRIRHFSLPHGLEAINGRLVFEPDGVRFDDLRATMGSGPVVVGGRVGLDGFEIDELGITAVGEQMQLRFPEGFRSVVDTDLVLRGGPTTPVLAGTVNVRDAVLIDEFDMGSGLIGGGEGTALFGGGATSTEPGPPLNFDVRIVAPSTLRMTSNTVRLVASAELTLSGTYDQPVLLGSIELERGEAFFDGNRYRLNHGTVGFANLTEIEPFVDVEIETDVRVPGQTYWVTVRATGTIDRLVPTLSSDPPLPEVDILSLLLGDIRDPLGADLRAARAPELAQQQRFQAGAARLLTSPLSSSVGRVVQDSFGVDTFQITPSLGDPSSQQSAQLNPTARVLIGKRISGRTHVTLSRALSGANRDLIVVLEHDQSDRLSWILSQNEDRTYALDFRVRH